MTKAARLFSNDLFRREPPPRGLRTKIQLLPGQAVEPGALHGPLRNPFQNEAAAHRELHVPRDAAIAQTCYRDGVVTFRLP